MTTSDFESQTPHDVTVLGCVQSHRFFQHIVVTYTKRAKVHFSPLGIPLSAVRQDMNARRSHSLSPKRSLEPTMERMCFFIQIYEGKELDYDKRHDELWPEMAQALTNCGWINYSLFREGTLAIGYVECIPNAATALATTAKQHIVPA